METNCKLIIIDKRISSLNYYMICFLIKKKEKEREQLKENWTAFNTNFKDYLKNESEC